MTKTALDLGDDEFRERTEALLYRMAKLLRRHSTIIKVMAEDLQELRRPSEPTEQNPEEQDLHAGSFFPLCLQVEVKNQREMNVAIQAIQEYQRVTNHRTEGGFVILMK